MSVTTTSENIETATKRSPPDNIKSDSPKKVMMETWGCQMNVADSERMLQLLQARNYQLTQDADEADLVVLNTCHIREKARHKVLSRLGVLKEFKARKPTMKIAVAGCVAQADGRRLLKAAPQIDLLFGPGKIDTLPALLDEEQNTRGPAVALGFDKMPSDQATIARSDSHDKDQVPISSRNNQVQVPVQQGKPNLSGKNEVSRYVNVQAGCNNFCTFCVVPFTRGREVSRTAEQIISEIRLLLDGGAKEVTLLGQNVNSYGLDLQPDSIQNGAAGPFHDLLKDVATLPGLQRLKFTTSNPHDFTKPLAELFKVTPKLGRYIHLPVQSGNDEMLQKMRRKVTVAQYHQRLAWLRTAVPDIAISTDLIVGFPGETEEQFEDTLQLVREAQYSFIFSFKYSPRRGTAAARFRDQIEESVKDQRLSRLNQLQLEITNRQVEREIGRQREVLFLYESRKAAGIYYGRTEHFRLVRVESRRNISGQLLPVEIVGGNKTALMGRLM